MPRVLTNEIALAKARESSPGVLAASPDWRVLEVNDITSYGTSTTTVTRQPISRSRRRKKGTPTDRDSAVEFVSDLTFSSFRDFIEEFLFASATNADASRLHPSAVTSTAYTIRSRGAGATALKSGHLIYARGFNETGNNGLKALSSALASTGTSVTVGASAATAEASPPDNAVISLAGFRATNVGNTGWTYNTTSKRGTLAHTDVGDGSLLTPGQTVHIGSLDAARSVQNALQSGAANDMHGYARVYSVSDDSIVFDRLDASLQRNSTAAGTVDILYGEFVRDVDTTSDEYLTGTTHFEAILTGLGGTETAPVDQYEYAVGNYASTMALSLPLTNKSEITYGFVGQDTEDITGARKTTSATRAAPLYQEAYNSVSNVARIRVAGQDDEGITTDLKSVTLNLDNNVSGEKVIGTLGNKYVNVGNFAVGVEAQALFTSAGVTNAINDNATVSLDFIIGNNDGVIAIDIPSMTLGGGGREYPVNESVLLSATGEAHEDAHLGTSIGASLIPVPLGTE